MDSATKELGFSVDLGQDAGLLGLQEARRATFDISGVAKTKGKTWAKRNFVMDKDKVMVANHFQTTKLEQNEMEVFLKERPLNMVLQRKINFNTDTWNA